MSASLDSHNTVDARTPVTLPSPSEQIQATMTGVEWTYGARIIYVLTCIACLPVAEGTAQQDSQLAFIGNRLEVFEEAVALIQNVTAA